MKLIFSLVVAILVLVLPMETQGAPSYADRITSEEVGKMVQILLEAQAMAEYQSIQEVSKVTAQVDGVEIKNCGDATDILNSALSFLNELLPGEFGLLVDCESPDGCAKIQIDVPAGTTRTEIEICKTASKFNSYS